MAEREIKIDKNGTRYYQDHETMELKFECQHCGTWFQTTRKFNQKYCCGSCRSMATKGNSKKSKTQEERIKMLEKRVEILTSFLNKSIRLVVADPRIGRELMASRIKAEGVSELLKILDELKEKKTK